MATRKTEQVLLEITGAAKERIFLTSFVAYEVESVVETMSRAIDRGVEVSIPLESSERHGGRPIWYLIQLAVLGKIQPVTFKIEKSPNKGLSGGFSLLPRPFIGPWAH